MNSVNVNVSVSNLPVVTQHQSEVHRAPIVHQQQISEEERDRFERQNRAPTEARETQGRIVDPKDHKQEKRRGNKKSKGRQEQEDEQEVLSDTGGITMSENGRFLDLRA